VVFVESFNVVSLLCLLRSNESVVGRRMSELRKRAANLRQGFLPDSSEQSKKVMDCTVVA
jgi:hypothetical protein